MPSLREVLGRSVGRQAFAAADGDEAVPLGPVVVLREVGLVVGRDELDRHPGRLQVALDERHDRRGVGEGLVVEELERLALVAAVGQQLLGRVDVVLVLVEVRILGETGRVDQDLRPALVEVVDDRLAVDRGVERLADPLVAPRRRLRLEHDPEDAGVRRPR